MKITVITVCYQSVATIGDTLKSVALQSYKDVEHLIIDGNSTDGTLDILRGWTQHPLKIISEPDHGIYDAMNKALKLATGEVIGFLNADDFFANENVLEKIAQEFKDSSVQATHADLVYVTRDNRKIIRYWKSKPFKFGDFSRGWCPAHPTFYVRKSVVIKIGLFDTTYKLAADIEFMMRCLEGNRIKILYIPHVLVRMRIGGASNKSFRSIFRQNSEILQALQKNQIPFSRIWFLTNKFYNRLGQFVVGWMRRND